MKRSRRIEKPDSPSKLELEEIIGLTTKNANGLSSSGSNNRCAYIAGCVVVVYDANSGTQSHFVVPNRMSKTLSCVAVSPDASLIAAGEAGNQPAIVLWEGATTKFVGELKGHQFGVACMAFSPDGKQIASVGFPRDGYICLWDLHSQMLLSKIKACSSCSAVESVCFSSNAKFIVTAGRKHLKFWTVELSTRSRANAKYTLVIIRGKPVNLGHQIGHSFIAVTSPKWINIKEAYDDMGGELPPTYALTDTGILYLLNPELSITKTVDLKVKKGFALTTSKKLVACACNNGIVKLFSINSLAYAGSLHSCGRYNKATMVDCQTKNQNEIQSLPTFPDAIACDFSTLENLVVIYDDRSVSIWNLHDVNKATRFCVIVSHSACIWDIKNLPCENGHNPSLACVTKGCPGGVSFTTCSADGTIRLWDLSLQPILSDDCFSLASNNNFTTSELGVERHHVSAGIFERDSLASGILSPGFRSMAVSSDGCHLAAGDCLGNIHILNLWTSEYLCIQDAHDADILSLGFSFTRKRNNVSDKVSEGHYILASGGQDRMIHIFDVERNFDLIGSVGDHSDAVKSIQFPCNGCNIASCGANGSVVLHDLAMQDRECKMSPSCPIASHGYIFDMALDPSTEVAVLVGKDKKINVVNIPSRKLVRSFKHDEDLGDPIEVTMDPSCTYLLCSFSNGSICMLEYATGKMVAQAAGHGGSITGVIFLPDCKHIASVDDDGCIFLWKVPGFLSMRILQRMDESSHQLPLESIAQPNISSCNEFVQLDDNQFGFYSRNLPAKGSLKATHRRPLFQDKGSQETSAFRFSVSRLPKWAQSKVTTPGSAHLLLNSCLDKQDGEKNRSSSTIYVLDDASVCPESQSPSRGSKQFSSRIPRNSSNTDISPGSFSHRHNDGFSLDNRWSTIHTVCFDLLNSPEDWEMKNQNIPLSALSNLSTDKPIETNKNVKQIKLLQMSPILDHLSIEQNLSLGKNTKENDGCLDEHALSYHSGTLCNSIGQCWVDNSSQFQEEIGNQMSTKLQFAATERDRVLTVDAGTSNLNSQHSDLSKTQSRKSSAKKIHLGKFVVKVDIGETMKFQEMSDRHFSSETPRRTKRSGTIPVLEDPSNQLIEVLHEAETSQQNEDARMNRQRPTGTDQPEKLFMGCKDALIHLDAAAEFASKLFYQLANLRSTGEILQGLEHQMHSEATEMLRSIAKNVNAVAQLVQSSCSIP